MLNQLFLSECLSNILRCFPQKPSFFSITTFLLPRRLSNLNWRSDPTSIQRKRNEVAWNTSNSVTVASQVTQDLKFFSWLEKLSLWVKQILSLETDPSTSWSRVKHLTFEKRASFLLYTIFRHQSFPRTWMLCRLDYKMLSISSQEEEKIKVVTSWRRITWRSRKFTQHETKGILFHQNGRYVCVLKRRKSFEAESLTTTTYT
jgi:hypothetical protein